MSKRDDKRDSAHKSQDQDAGSSFQSEAVKAFVGAVRASDADLTKTDLIDFLMPHLLDLDREVTETVAGLDGKVSDLASLANQKSDQLNQLMGRQRREKETLPVNAKAEFAHAMLSVVDAVDAAVSSLVGADESVQEGVRSISRLMDNALKSQGFSKIDAIGNQYDPKRHEGIGETESTDHDEGIVIEVVQGGYVNESTGRLLRPSRVIVAKRPTRDAEGHGESVATENDSK